MSKMMPEPDGGGLRKGPPKPPTKTMTGMPDPDSNDFERLLRQLKPKLDKLPDELRIPAVPPHADAAEEVAQYVREKLGLEPAGEVPSWVIIGTECVERPKIHEGRIGLLNGVPVFAFLYPYEAKRLRTVVIHVKDGLLPRMIAKAILWGIVGEIPDAVAHGEIRSVDDFFSLRCLDAGQLVDTPRLAKAKEEIERVASERCASVTAKLGQSESACVSLRKSLGKSEAERQQSRKDAIRQHNRAEVWKLVAITGLGAGPLVTLVIQRLLS